MIVLMAVAHLIHGWIGAGKTTFARRLEEEVSGVRLCIDEWYLRLFTDGSPTDVIDPNLEGRLTSRLDSLWPRILARGIDVVLDFGFWQRERRDRARQLAGTVGADTKLYWVQCEEATALERLLRRNVDPGDNWRLEEHSFDYLRSKYEPLGPDEEHEVVRTEAPSRSWPGS